MVYKMIDSNVLVKPIFETVSEGGIVVKQDILPKTLKGEVLAVANHPDCEGIKVNDIVIFHKHAGKNFIEDRQLYRIIPAIDIEAIIEEN